MAKKSRVNYVSWIYRKIQKRIPLLVLYTALSSAVAYAGIRFSLTTKSVINSAISADRDGLTISCIILVCLSLFRLIGNMLNKLLSVNLMEKLERDFKYSILRHILRADYSEICRYHSGDLVHRMNNDAATVYSSILSVFGGLIGTATGLVAAVAALMKLAPEFTLAFGCISIALASSAMLFKKLLKQLS